MDDAEDFSGAAEDLLSEAEARALAILNETGFGQFVGRLESDEAWNALNAARKASDDPLSPGVRASRASICVVLVELIRSATLDRDLDALIRYSASLGGLDQDLLGHAERDAIIAVRNRRRGVDESIQTRRDRRDDNHELWIREANRHRANNSGASERAVASHVAKVCGAKIETVRKALRADQRKTDKTKARKNPRLLG